MDAVAQGNSMSSFNLMYLHHLTYSGLGRTTEICEQVDGVDDVHQMLVRGHDSSDLAVAQDELLNVAH